jgi:hypothetical protein
MNIIGFINYSRGLKHVAYGLYMAHQSILYGSLTNHLAPKSGKLIMKHDAQNTQLQV